ncbi:MAG: GtrA family protein [Clostridia bacterium]|nr:GtrA family protein [Clostridia bacterium]
MKLKDLLTRKNLGRFFRYFVTGASSSVVEIVLFWLLTEKLFLSPTVSHIAVYTATFWMCFLMNKFWTFKSRTGFLPQLLKYSLLYLFNLTITSVLLSALVAAGLHAILAKLCVMLAMGCWNFFIYRYVIYK